MCPKCNKKIKPLGMASHQRACVGELRCVHCDELISGRKRKFCTYACFTEFERHREFSDEHRERISCALVGRKLTEEHKQKISHQLAGRIGRVWTDEDKKCQSEKRRKYLLENPEKHPNALCRGRKSYPQNRLATKLAECGFSVSVEHPCHGYWIDILVDDVLAVEVDGEYWHKNRVESDHLKNLKVSFEYTVRRYPATQVLLDVDSVISDIRGVIAYLGKQLPCTQ